MNTFEAGSVANAYRNGSEVTARTIAAVTSGRT